MIYRRSFHAEVVRNCGALAVLYGGLVALFALGRLLADNTALPLPATLALVALNLLKSAPQLLTAALFGALVMTFGRMRASGELAAWGAAGLGARHWHLATLALSLPAALTVWVLAAHSAPWSLRYSSSYLQAVSETLRLEDSSPSLFGEFPARGLVYHLDAISEERGEALGVFIARITGAAQVQVVTAGRARTEHGPSGLRRLRLDGGTASDLDFTTGTGSKISFAEGDMQLGADAPTDNSRLRARALPDLAGTQAGATEWWWRTAFAPALMLLCALALPLARLTRTAGHAVVLALLAYWLFYAAGGLLKDWGIGGRLPAAAAALAPAALLALALLASFLPEWRNQGRRG